RSDLDISWVVHSLLDFAQTLAKRLTADNTFFWLANSEGRDIPPRMSPPAFSGRNVCQIVGSRVHVAPLDAARTSSAGSPYYALAGIASGQMGIFIPAHRGYSGMLLYRSPPL